MSRTLFALAFASLGSDASTKAPSKAEPYAPVRIQRSGEADQQDEHPGGLKQPETPIINSSQFGGSINSSYSTASAVRFALPDSVCSGLASVYLFLVGLCIWPNIPGLLQQVIQPFPLLLRDEICVNVPGQVLT